MPLAGQRQVDAAFAYLGRTGAGRALIERAERSRTPHRIEIVHRHNDAYLPWSHTIRWDPTSAMRTTGGGSQSPALGLAHELDHALAGGRAFDRLVEAPDPAFDNAEERRVILGSERETARALHESTRRDHDGVCYRVTAPAER